MVKMINRLTLPLGTAATGVMLAALVAMFFGCTSEHDNDYKALAALDLKCPDGSQLQYQAWGKAGREAVCIVRQGPVAMAENGHLVVRGEYSGGKPTGKWQWFDATGAVVKEEIHQNDSPRR
jgi:hypothetical protein